MSYALTPIQYITLGLALLLVGVVIGQMRLNLGQQRRRGDLPRQVWILSWAVHTVVFYIATLVYHLGYVELPHTAWWSSVLRLHGVATFLAIEGLGLIDGITRKKRCTYE